MERRTKRISHVLINRDLGRGGTFGDGESRGPLITEDIKTNTSVGVDIWMIDSCREVYLPVSISYAVKGEGLQKGVDGYLWWFEGVVCGKVNREEKHAAGIWTIALKHTVSTRYIRTRAGKG